VTIDPELMRLLVCPRCKGSLAEDGTELACAGCGARYPVREGLPVLLVREEAPPE
jgi:uncharacterized protein